MAFAVPIISVYTVEVITENVIVAVLAVSPGMLTVVAGVLRVVVAMLIVALVAMGG